MPTLSRRRRRYPAVAVKGIIFSEDALADTRELWRDGVAHLARRLGRVVPLDAAEVPDDRAEAIEYLERWAGQDAANWRAELARFYEDHIPVYLRPDPELNAALRQITGHGLRTAAWSPGPPEASLVVSHFLGVARHLDTQAVAPGPGGWREAAIELDLDPPDLLVVAATASALEDARAAGTRTAGALWTGMAPDALLPAHPDVLAGRTGELLALALA